MSNITKSLIAFSVVAGIFGVSAFFGLTPYGKTVVEQLAGNAPAGSTFNTQKQAGVAMAPIAITGTSTSVANPDPNGSFIQSTILGCTGVGSSQTYLTGVGLTSTGWLLQAATTTTSGLGLQGNTNYSLNMAIATATAATNGGFVNQATTTLPWSAGYWPGNALMSFGFNATNTAACTVSMTIIPL